MFGVKIRFRAGAPLGGVLTVWAIVLTILLAVHVLLGGWLVPYTANSWLAYAGSSARLVWWHGAVLGCIPGVVEVAIPASVVTVVLMSIL